jgi:NAD(P)H-flavin reductase
MTDDSSWDGESRRIDGDLLRDHLDEELQALTYLIAGPPAMVEGVSEALQTEGVPEDQVQAGKFSGY